MSTFNAWASALIPAGTSLNTLQSTMASVMSSSGSAPWQITRQSVIGTVWNTGGTPATSPGNAMDLTSTSYASGTVPVYVGIYYASGFTPTHMYVQADTTNYATDAPLTFTLDYSSNGSSWTTLQSFSSQTVWQSCERRKYTITGATSQTYWRINVTAVQSSTTLQLGEWLLEDVNNNWLTTINFFDCIPPTIETIGNSYAREELRWTFPAGGTAINFTPLETALSPFPELWTWDAPTAGAVTLSVTINSNVVSYVGSSGNTGVQNARGIYEACKESANSNFTALNWQWNPNGANDSRSYFFATQVTPATNTNITSSNITTRLRGTSVPNVPLAQNSQMANSQVLTIDLTNGWIYYLQICNRGIAIGSKTNAGYYGVIHACYGDSASSLSQLPTSELAGIGIPCTPIELFVGYDQAVNYSGGVAYPTHWWGIQSAWTLTSYPVPIDGSIYAVSSSINHMQASGILQDWAQNGMATGSTGGISPAIVYAEGFQSGNPVVVGYNVHKMSIVEFASNTSYSVSNNTSLFFSNPSYSNIDWYRFTGTAPSNEQLIIIPLLDYTTTISTTGLNTDTTLSVASTTGFPTSGWLILDGEIINYGGTTSTTFTSCVRGKYASTAISPIIGTTVYIAGWFCYINAGLIFGGYSIPT